MVVAQNFAPGTTAADIESVMVDVGGEVTECKLTAEEPTVIAEMTFVNKSGAEAVINTFNGKKVSVLQGQMTKELSNTLLGRWAHTQRLPQGWRRSQTAIRGRCRTDCGRAYGDRRERTSTRG